MDPIFYRKGRGGGRGGLRRGEEGGGLKSPLFPIIVCYDHPKSSSRPSILQYYLHFSLHIIIATQTHPHNISSNPTLHPFSPISSSFSSSHIRQTPTHYTYTHNNVSFHHRHHILNNRHIPQVSNALRAEFARGDGRVKKKEDERRKKIMPNETLFVVNFHEESTKREDLEMLFSPFGELVRIDMKRNYAFVQFKTIEEAMRAKDATNGGKLDQSEITVEFVARRMGEGGGGGGRGGGDRGDRRGSGGGGGGGRRYDDRGEFHISSCGLGESLQGMYRFVFFSQQ